MDKLFDFLDVGGSPYHAVEETANILEKEGFIRLEEVECWNLQRGKKYYVTRNQSSIIAFSMPMNTPDCYHLTASHSDSPSFRIKKLKMDDKQYARAEVEGYGGMIYSSWLDRPLGVAGRIVVQTEKGVCTKLIAPDKDLFVIPNLAIHMNQDINKGYRYNPQVDLQPLYGSIDTDLQTFLCEEEEAKLLDMDLFLTVRQKATTIGAKGEYYMSPRIDDLACAYATLTGFVKACLKKEKDSFLDVFCMFDNEEVGSGTRQGAMSTFLTEVLMRVEESYHMTPEQCIKARNSSLLISADNAHATHPNLPAKADSEFPVLLNQGIVIKYNASQRYTTTGLTAAVFEKLCEKASLSIQRFVNRADAQGGSTLGNLLSHQFSIPMLDIGLPQLAMHSAVETAGCADVKDMERAIEAFYMSNIRQIRDGEWCC